MRNGKLIGFAATILAVLCLVGTYAVSQEKSTGQQPAAQQPAAGAMDEAAMMKAYMEASMPGPHHKAMEAMAGKFKYTCKAKMDPSQDWTTTEGQYDGMMVLDGRYITSTVSGPMMGMNFTGMGCLGYDNTLKKHVAGWIDNMGTGIMRSEGTCDGTCKTITFEGEMLDPVTRQPCKYKYVYEIKSNDEFAMRWWSPNPADGKMFESMNIVYTRVK